MSDDALPLITKQELLTRVRSCLREESGEGGIRPENGQREAGSNTYDPLISIADSLDHHAERLFRLSSPRTGLPLRIKQRFILFRIPVINTFAAKLHSLLFSDANEGLRETAQSLELVSQALRSLAADRKASHGD
jgi:hypothetical protein